MSASGQSAAGPVQEAIYAALDGVISAPVYDEVPAGAAFPYVTLGDAIETRDDAHGRPGRDLVMSVHVWSRDTSSDEAQTITREIDLALDHRYNELTVTGWRLVLIENEATRLLRVPNAAEGTATRHAILQYRVRVHE